MPSGSPGEALLTAPASWSRPHGDAPAPAWEGVQCVCGGRSHVTRNPDALILDTVSTSHVSAPPHCPPASSPASSSLCAFSCSSSLPPSLSFQT